MVDEGRVARLLRAVEERVDRLQLARAEPGSADAWRLDAVKYLFVTARAMGRAAGFRNVLVHQYAVVDDDRVVAHLDELGDLQAFVEQVSAWMTR